MRALERDAAGIIERPVIGGRLLDPLEGAVVGVHRFLELLLIAQVIPKIDQGVDAVLPLVRHGFEQLGRLVHLVHLVQGIRDAQPRRPAIGRVRLDLAVAFDRFLVALARDQDIADQELRQIEMRRQVERDPGVEQHDIFRAVARQRGGQVEQAFGQALGRRRDDALDLLALLQFREVVAQHQAFFIRLELGLDDLLGLRRLAVALQHRGVDADDPRGRVLRIVDQLAIALFRGLRAAGELLDQAGVHAVHGGEALLGGQRIERLQRVVIFLHRGEDPGPRDRLGKARQAGIRHLVGKLERRVELARLEIPPRYEQRGRGHGIAQLQQALRQLGRALAVSGAELEHEGPPQDFLVRRVLLEHALHHVRSEIEIRFRLGEPAGEVVAVDRARPFAFAELDGRLSDIRDVACIAGILRRACDENAGHQRDHEPGRALAAPCLFRRHVLF